jgi:L-seryl-tRNA(Ser) seleniumtransferase
LSDPGLQKGLQKGLQERLRGLPSVEELLGTEPLRSAAQDGPRQLAVAAARAQIDRHRARLRAGDSDGLGPAQVPGTGEMAVLAAADLKRLQSSTLRPVINATGVVLHTNLGRAPLAEEAIERIELVARGYSSLEYDLVEGRRGSRHVHVEGLIAELTGAEAGMAVNNNAAAVLLALAALAPHREVVISRGQLVEIGGSFRIPEILAVSGASLVEVGTTNRTRAGDYQRAIGERTAVLMRVHCSNFRTVGFTEEVPIGDLCRLALEHGLAVIDDLGSGVLTGLGDPLDDLLRDEPSARRSIAAGADVLCFSGDKLLGGPQAGVIAGKRESIERLRSHPLARALRIDKLSLAALEATLTLYREPERAVERLPVLRMLGAATPELEARARRLLDSITSGVAASVASAEVTLARASGRAGGGALPLLELEGSVVSVRPVRSGADRLQAGLRSQDPPIVARVNEGAVLLDPRTIDDADLERVAAGVVAALA